MNMIFYYDKKLGGRLVVRKYFSNFFWHGANFRIRAQHHRKRRKSKFHRSMLPGSRLILINPYTFGMTLVLILNSLDISTANQLYLEHHEISLLIIVIK